MEELEKCPVCGKSPSVQSDGWRVWYSVSCDCGNHTDEFRSEKEAIKSWNEEAKQ